MTLKLLIVAAAAGMLAAAGPAEASSVLLDQTQQVPAGNGYSDPVFVPGAGELSMSLTDLDFPAAFGSLQFDVTGPSNGGTAPLLVPLTNAGSPASLALSGPMTLYVDVFTQPGQYDRGLFNVDATFESNSAVPVPASGPLLIAAVLVLVGMASLPKNWKIPRGKRRPEDRAQLTATQ